MTDAGQYQAAARADAQASPPTSSNSEPSAQRRRSGATTSADEKAARPKSSRSTRSRENTRRKLIDAALLIMAEKGVDGTAIADITEAADVGFGSFYNHFSSKNEIAGAVFAQRASELGRVTDAITEHETDKAVAVAYIQKVFLTKAIDDPVWGWFIVRVQLGLPEVIAAFEQRADADLMRGVEQGRFSLGCVNTATRIILAGLMAVTRAMLEGDAKPSAANETIECFLRMIGVPADEARQLSRRRLPRYVLKLIDEMRHTREHP